MRHKRVQQICIEPGCGQRRICMGRCLMHFRHLDPRERDRFKLMTRADRNKEFDQVPLQLAAQPKWSWVGDEQTLIEQYGENQDLRN
jgi:hypothetical protein